MNKLALLFLWTPLVVFSQHSIPTFIATISPSLYSTAYGDLDNDGRIDLVFAGSDNISWSKNIDGNGKWSVNQPIDLHYVNAEREIHLADLDGDGFLDVVVGYTPHVVTYIQWYKNEGGKRFSTPRPIATREINVTGTETSIACGDINNDGFMDVAVSYRVSTISPSAITWYRNEDGLGNFSIGGQLTPVASRVEEIRLALINNDAYPDVVVLSEDNPRYVIYRNLNGAGFEQHNVATTGSSNAFSVADIDADGRMDIVGDLYSDRIVWHKNLTTGNQISFGAAQVLTDELDGSVQSLTFADLDNDDDADILYTVFPRRLGFLENLGGNPSYADPQTLHEELGLLPQNDQAPFAFDYDNDGDSDILIMGQDARDERFVFINDGTGFFSDIRPLITSGLLGRVAFGDIDGDGYADLVSSYQNSPYALCWFRYNSAIEMWENPIAINSGPSSGVGSQLDVFDINGDGAPDILYAAGRWVLNDGNGGFSAYSSLDCGAPVSDNRKVYIADLNNDGLQDLVIAYSTHGVVWHKNLGGNNGFAACEDIYTGSGVSRITLEDFDDDGFVDIFPVLAGSIEVGWIRNNHSNGAGNLFSDWQYLVTTGFGPFRIREIAIVRRNENGLRDIITFLESPQSAILLFRALTPMTYATPIELDVAWEHSELTVTDYDLDGISDLLFARDEDVMLKKGTDLHDLYRPAREINLDQEGLPSEGLLTLTNADLDEDKDLVFKAGTGIFCSYNLSTNGSITASAFYDENSNGQLDSTEHHLHHIHFDIDPQEIIEVFELSDETRFLTPEGTYIVSSSALPGWHMTTDSTQQVNFSGDTTILVYFGYAPDSLFTTLTPSLESGPTRCNSVVPFWLTYTNDGTTIEQGFIKLFPRDSMATLVEAFPAADSILNDTLYWYFNELAPTHGSSIFLGFQMPDFQSAGDTLGISLATCALDSATVDYVNSVDFQSVILCAIDPNDKLVQPGGYFEANYVLFGQELDYTIRFQNVGNDTAFNVVILDELSPHLDWETFQVLSSSHAVQADLYRETGEVRFTFSNILLPDHTTNPVLSQGYVKYRIHPRDSLPEGTAVENHADIFFDFNPPITTNTTLNTFISGFPIFVSSEIIPPFCHGDSTGTILLETMAVPPVSYTWDSPLLSGPYNEEIVPAGDYHVIITDGFGGTRTDSFHVSEPTLLDAAISATPQVDNALGTATCIPQGGVPPYTIRWNTSPFQHGMNALNLAAGTYTVDVWDDNGCHFSDTVEVELVVSTQTPDAAPGVDVFPNPSNGNFTVELSRLSGNFEVVIMDISGALMYRHTFSAPDEKGTMQLKDMKFPAGIYVIEVKTRAGSAYERLVIIP